MRNAVLWDSSAILAALDADDADHALAEETVRRIVEERRASFVTNYVEVEAHALLLGRLGRVAARQWLFHSGIDVHRATAEEEFRGREILRTHADKNWSLCDAISFAVAERRHAIAFSFDHHFRQYGHIEVWGLPAARRRP